jgi:hypothetical protein
VGGTGSLALGREKIDLFHMACNGWLDKIEVVLNHFAVPRLFGCNEFPGLVEFPRIEHSVVAKPNLDVLGKFVADLAPLIPLTDEDKGWVHTQAGMPEYVPVAPVGGAGEQGGKGAEVQGSRGAGEQVAGVMGGTVHHVWDRQSPLVHVKLEKMSKGYNWEITFEGEKDAEVQALLEKVDEWLRAKYGEPDTGNEVAGST